MDPRHAPNPTTRARPRTFGQRGLHYIGRDVLLIEDQRALADLVSEMLRDRWGCRVVVAHCLAEVKAILTEQQHNDFFVAVSDLNLPDAPNGEVINTLIAAKLPTIAVTGQYDRNLLDRILDKGVIDYVLKDSINSYEYVIDLIGRIFRNSLTKVLLVEDATSTRQLYRRMLEVQRLNVLEAADGETALAQLKQYPDIKLVLLDYALPGMSGHDVLAAIRRKFPKDQLAVIGISGTGERDVYSQFLRLGANDFLAKPFSYEALVNRVSHALQMQEMLESFRFIAYHDHLAGLLNRRAFFEQGGKLYEQFCKEKRPLLVAMLDIDHFKRINDRYDHHGGDEVLQQFAKMLEKTFHLDLVARIGGEEFAMLTIDSPKTRERFDAFRKQVEATVVSVGEESLQFTVSIGLAQSMQGSLDAMIAEADKALYAAKASGRNRVVMA
jgi:diguanylate cyclase (GGDEF)-like protein